MYSENSKNNCAASVAAKIAEPTLADLIARAKRIGDESFEEAAATDSVEKFPVETLRKIAESTSFERGAAERIRRRESRHRKRNQSRACCRF